MSSKQKTTRCAWLFGLFTVTAFLVLAHGPSAYAQSIVVMVNDEPITSYDVAQRQRFLAMTSGLGDTIRARLKSDKTKEEFKAFMIERQPKSREEAQELQKEFVAQLQQKIVANTASAKRKEAIDQLVEERLMIQAAKERKIEVTDDEVSSVLTSMAQGGSQKRTLKEFLASFSAQGVNPVTLKERIRAQSAWRRLIRQLYGPLIRSTVSAASSDNSKDNTAGTVIDVEIVKLTASSDDSQKAIARRLVEAEEIRKKFSSCSKLSGLLKGRGGVSVQSVKKAKLEDFQGDVKAALAKAKPGEMTPPVIKGDIIEAHALCSKKVTAPSKKDQKDADGGDKVQEEFQIYSRRHLKDLRDRALLKYSKKG